VDNPILRGYTEKKQPLVISPDHLRNSIILIACILGTGIICLFSSCDMIRQPARAEVLTASWYSIQSLKDEGTYKHSKGLMGNGAVFSDNGMTCATRLYPLGSLVCVTNIENNKKVYVEVTDRIGKRFANTRIDLSKKAFSDLTNGNLNLGLVKVRVEEI